MEGNGESWRKVYEEFYMLFQKSHCLYNLFVPHRNVLIVHVVIICIYM